MRIIPFPRQQGQGLRRILSKSCKRRGAIPSCPPLSGRHRQMQHAILQSLRSKNTVMRPPCAHKHAEIPLAKPDRARLIKKGRPSWRPFLRFAHPRVPVCRRLYIRSYSLCGILAKRALANRTTMLPAIVIAPITIKAIFMPRHLLRAGP